MLDCFFKNNAMTTQGDSDLVEIHLTRIIAPLFIDWILLLGVNFSIPRLDLVVLVQDIVSLVVTIFSSCPMELTILCSGHMGLVVSMSERNLSIG